MNTKAKLYVGKKLVLELEGTQAFVKKYLDKYLLANTETSNSRKTKSKKKPKVAKAKPAKPMKVKPPRKKSLKPVKIVPEEIILDEEQGLKALLDEKQPSNSGKTILVIGYYINHILNEETFSLGQLEFVYKALNRKDRPANFASIISRNRREHNWFENAKEKGQWRVTRIGELFVEESLPEE